MQVAIIENNFDIESRLEAIDASVAELSVMQVMNLRPLIDRVARLDMSIKNLPQPKEPEKVDMSPVLALAASVAEIKAAMAAIDIPKPDFSAVLADIADLKKSLRAMSAAKPDYSFTINRDDDGTITNVSARRVSATGE